ncbi:MAG: TonB-dependent receptor [Asticcacaulis sp.]
MPHKKKIQMLGSVAAIGLLVAVPAYADDFAADAADHDADVTQVVVTGTRATGRTVQNSAAPIDVISSRDLANTGQTTVLESLNRLLPSLNVPAQVQPDIGSIVRGAQLRGLDPAYTLVLVNGKRRHTTANVNEDGFAGSVATDLGLIPAGSIARIEVLRDGASAVYGSDAIAGVINIILKDADSPGGISIQTGKTYEGDGASNIVRFNHGFRLGDRASLAIAAEVAHQDRTIRNFPLKDSYLIYPAIDSNGNPVRLGTNNSLPAGTTADPREATRDDRAWINAGQRRFTVGSVSYNFDYDLGGGTEFYSFGTYAQRKAHAGQNFRPANTVFIQNPSLLNTYPDGFTPFEVTDEVDIAATVGLQGQTANWNWDLSTTFGSDKIDASVRNSANYSLPGTNAQTVFHVGQHFYSNQTTNLDLARQLTFAGHEFDFSFGLQHRHERAKLKAGEPLSYFGLGSNAIRGYQPVDAYDNKRDSWGAYTGLATNITPKWFLDGAVRYENFDDFGDSTTGRLSTRYDFTPAFALRATVSNGFHAPNLVTQSYSNTSDQAGLANRLAQPDSAAALALGSTPLKPEESTNYSVGLTWNPFGTVRLAVDAYQVEVRHQIGGSPRVGINRSSGTAVDANGVALTPAQEAYIDGLLQQAGFAAGSSLIVRYFTDIGDTRNTGVDFTAEATTLTDWGRFRWTFAANYNEVDITRISGTPAALQSLPNIGSLSLANQYNLKYRAPNDKQVFGVTFDRGAWTVDFRTTRYGKLTRYAASSGEYKLDASYIADLNVAYAVSDKLRVTLSANNLFDEYPQKVPVAARTAASLAQYEDAWDNTGPVGLSGGSYNIRLDYNF